MGTALALLFLLALGAVPGALLPQRNLNESKVIQYIAEHPRIGPWLDRLQAFDVFSSFWFTSIYVLLFVSLVGCLVPRMVDHIESLRATPVPAPRNLSRLPKHAEREVSAEPDALAETINDRLTGWRRVTRKSGDGIEISAEKGYLREFGNLVFHFSLLGLLVAVAVGKLFGYEGNVIIIADGGPGFCSASPAAFDSFRAGNTVDGTSLKPICLRVDDFQAHYLPSGQATSFAADIDYQAGTDLDTDTWRPYRLEVNHPLRIGGDRIYLQGHGYAPTFTVTDASGQVVFHDSVVFLPQDGMFTSTGVVKVPDAQPQLGLQGFFLPTAAVDATTGPHSTFPAADDPAVFVSAWTGDLGLDSGSPQSVYQLDTSRMTQHGIKALRPGQTWQVPSTGLTVRFDGFVQFASFSVARDPGKELALLSALAAMAGLALSLLIRRRRVWVRVSGPADDGGPAAVEVAGLARSEHDSVAAEVDAVLSCLTTPPDRAQEAPEWTA